MSGHDGFLVVGTAVPVVPAVVPAHLLCLGLPVHGRVLASSTGAWLSLLFFLLVALFNHSMVVVVDAQKYEFALLDGIDHEHHGAVKQGW